MRLVPLGAAGPGEVDLTEPVAGELGRLPFGELVRSAPEVDVQERAQLFLLRRLEVRRVRRCFR